ncbi:expressed unknown protein [Seminavis robusta]|uniref:Uncharacterized protein n=1 Tax=Seminavis robusta TaxID=568900 RepID=A0A9N8E3G1_9STRA|nr:expressed unknown protein [Seminavis robusta]|eukprot:Sro515_g158280.1 n/a (258) ;mRNA; r:25005-25778
MALRLLEDLSNNNNTASSVASNETVSIPVLCLTTSPCATQTSVVVVEWDADTEGLPNITTEGILLLSVLGMAIFFVTLVVLVRCHHRFNGIWRCIVLTGQSCDLIEVVVVAMIGLPLAIILGVVAAVLYLWDLLLSLLLPDHNKKKKKKDNSDMRMTATQDEDELSGNHSRRHSDGDLSLDTGRIGESFNEHQARKETFDDDDDEENQMKKVAPLDKDDDDNNKNAKMALQDTRMVRDNNSNNNRFQDEHLGLEHNA